MLLGVFDDFDFYSVIIVIDSVIIVIDSVIIVIDVSQKEII